MEEGKKINKAKGKLTKQNEIATKKSFLMKNEMQQQQKSLEHKENEKKEKEGEAEDCLQSSLIKAHAHK